MSEASVALVRIPHRRLPWANEVVTVITRWGKLKGADESVRRDPVWGQLYLRAKRQADFDAATALIERAVSENPQALDSLVDVLVPFVERGIPVVCVVPHPGFDDEDGSDGDLPARYLSQNAIPQTFAAYIAEVVGATVDQQIIQRERVGRTRLNYLERFLWQPSFTGVVRDDVVYVLVDDVLTLGGTLAALRSYIKSNGGNVVAITALANRNGKPQRLAILAKTRDAIRHMFGPGFDGFWTREVGHDADCLTEAEGQHLVTVGEEIRQERSGRPALQCLRDRLAAAAATGRK